MIGETVYEAGEVGGGGVEGNGAEIHEAGYVIAGEENVVVPDVAEAWLQGQGSVGERFELTDCAWNRVRQFGQELAGERQEFGPNVVADGVSQIGKSAWCEVAEAGEVAVDCGWSRFRPRFGLAADVKSHGGVVEFCQCVHCGGEFCWSWVFRVISGARHPGGEFPEMAGVFDERFAISCRNG